MLMAQVWALPFGIYPGASKMFISPQDKYEGVVFFSRDNDLVVNPVKPS